MTLKQEKKKEKSQGERFVLICYVWYSPNTAPWILTKHLYFGLIGSKEKKIYIQECCEWFKYNFANWICAVMLFLERRGFQLSLSHPSKQAKLEKYFSNYTVENFNI